jgi:hypothetical protein
MLLFSAPKNRTIVRLAYPDACIVACLSTLAPGVPHFCILHRRHGSPISPPAPTRAAAWREAAQAIARAQEAATHE